MFGGKMEHVIRRLCTALGKDVNLLAEPGIINHYNGLELVQTCEYVHIHVGPYIDKILDGHGWNVAGKDESRMIEPIHPGAVKEVDTAVGPECTNAASKLAVDAGFKYRTCIGEIIFSYVMCRPDIGYGVAELLKLSTNLAAVPYITLKGVFRYLCQTKQYGLLYWRPVLRPDLPHMPFADLRPMDELDRTMPTPIAIYELCGYLDAAHVKFLHTRWSISTHVFCLNGDDISYRAKWIATVCLSSTEGELVAFIGVAKVTTYLQAVLIELGLLKLKATVLFE
jgi:hypothetical protein